MRDYILKQINARQEELASLESRRLVLNAELGAYKDILAQLSGPASTDGVGSPATETQPQALPAEPKTSHVAGRGPEGLKWPEHWNVMFEEIVRRFPRVVTNEEANNIASRAAGVDVPRSQVRNRLHELVKRELLERVRDGVVRGTRHGAAAIGMDLADEGHANASERNEAPNGLARGASEAGEGCEPSLWSNPRPVETDRR
jgi:hypothetical protein